MSLFSLHWHDTLHLPLLTCYQLFLPHQISVEASDLLASDQIPVKDHGLDSRNLNLIASTEI
jgi:hypothetical protein